MGRKEDAQREMAAYVSIKKREGDLDRAAEGKTRNIPWSRRSDRDSCSGPADAGCRVPGPGRCDRALGAPRPCTAPQALSSLPKPRNARATRTAIDAAIDSYRQALKLKPEWDEGLWYLGTLLYEKENYFEACTVLRNFLGSQSGKRIRMGAAGIERV